MSIRDFNKALIVSNATTGDIILSELMTDGVYSASTIDAMISDLIDSYVWEKEQGILIKVGFKK